ncbi:heavy-metal-associated domain-containing protein [Nocardioides sp. ChNu-153]|uniref:heavy-metal-associated domain-containing protein n=1 Tax=unclassified Nocardioides TaxID=2615069 RepID=UPI002407321B|nr:MULTISPECIES: heavy-metal-associated domain-containing protein [unclassified Nocardioides]MDF9718056.1 heavy-metal-associated domain-containing protein [Nocardioides sp. ChNu-99]MDN7121200.1 heavy-metal-associated domain-containing protein [Nocardioides sp. ChNu-153]
MSMTTFTVTGMTCGHCEASVREEVSAVAGVEQIEVDAARGTLVVIGNSVDDATVLAAVAEAGYQAQRS